MSLIGDILNTSMDMEQIQTIHRIGHGLIGILLVDTEINSYGYCRTCHIFLLGYDRSFCPYCNRLLEKMPEINLETLKRYYPNAEVIGDYD